MVTYFLFNGSRVDYVDCLGGFYFVTLDCYNLYYYWLVNWGTK